MRNTIQLGAADGGQGYTAPQQGDASAARPSPRPAPARRPWPFTVSSREQPDTYARLQNQDRRPIDEGQRQQQQAGSSQDL